MKVAFITHYPELYGANRSLLALLSFLQEQGKVKPYLICSRDGELPKLAATQNIPCAIVPFLTWMSERVYMGGMHHKFGQYLRYKKQERAKAKTNLSLLKELRTQISDWACDLVYTNSSVIGIGHQVAQRMGLPHIWHVREFAKGHYNLHLDLGKWAFKRALNKATRLIAISNAMEQHLVSITGRKDIHVIYNGVLRRSEFLSKRAQCPWPESEVFTFGMVGLIHPSKGHLEALEAVAQLGKNAAVRLIIAGSGKLEKLKDRIAELGIQNKVEFLGYVDDPYEVYAQCHALLMCSKKEGMGRVTAEAMAAGRPVIGANDGATPELIEHGITGFLYSRTEDLHGLMQALIDDSAKAEGMGVAGAEVAAERFSIEQYGEKVLAILKEVELGRR